ncbi:MAG TPA: polysaccharide deacetylase family protein [Polyangia bacterium]|nr:polysaccharide deacetylase family protein [Polyangia bacterium]
MNARPPASLSLDLDNLWSYMKIHGDAGWESHPSYLDALAEIVTDRLRRHRLTLTIFVVGQDAALEKNQRALRRLAEDGHDIGNHSFSHEPWFHTYAYADVAREIGQAEQAIERATGTRPRGFRGPGFSISADTLRVLGERGYIYDASTFPTFLGPLARTYYFWKTDSMSPEERKKRKQLFGKAGEGLRPLQPYLWDLPDHRLLEIPVTTMPIARTPFHMSYLLYLSGFSAPLARTYLRSALALCRLRGVQPSFLLHPLDFLGGDCVKELAFFPGMKLKTEHKLALFDDLVAIIKSSFEPVTMAEHARRLLANGNLRSRSL